jgi:hypothetical protein
MLLSAARAAALVATLVCGWSLNLRWGDAAAVGAGPPMQWERHVVGTTLLAGLVLVASFFGGRSSARGRPPLVARAVALLAALGAVAIALWLHRDAARGFTSLVAGPGWSSLAAGAGLALVGALLFQWARRPVTPGATTGKSSRHRRP